MLTPTEVDLDPETKKNVEAWLQGTYDEATKKEVIALLENNPEKITDAFYTRLNFGTGGLRGIMGIGSNRMNIYTVQAATQGLAQTIHLVHCQTEIEGGKPSLQEGSPAVFIGYDSRLHSKEFAEEAACVLAGNGIKAYICDELRPTPLVSFACRHYGCIAAIMITASHNPQQYNGYKVFWSDGAQVTPPYDRIIIEQVNQIQGPQDVHKSPFTSAWIHRIGSEIDDAYLEATSNLQLYPEIDQHHGHRLKIVYSSLHGTGITLVPQILGMWGFTQVIPVAHQCKPDGHFPTVKSPNPEEPEALKMGMQTLLDEHADIFLATDPDADRIGVVVRSGEETHILNGNQIACLCVDHVLRSQKNMPSRSACIKTIVTTELFQKICDYYHVECFNTLTGFKYIAEMIRTWEKEPDKGYHFLFGGEESYGYLFGTLTRDKDAITLSALISEIALQCKLEEKTLMNRLEEIYKRHGVYEEQLISISFPETKEGRKRMTRGLDALRSHPPQSLLGTAIEKTEDYLIGKSVEAITGKETPLTLPKSDVIALYLEDKTQLVIRPSGTEPKIKLYASVYTSRTDPLSDAIEHAKVLCEEYLIALKHLLQG